MSEVSVDFSGLKEPTQDKYIQTAGIWRAAVINSFFIAPMVPKDAKKPEGEKKGGWLEIELETPKDGKFTVRYFPIAKSPADVKYVGKVYGAKGEELRDKTKEEQLQDDYESYAYFLIQIGMALGNEFQNVNRIVAGAPKSFEGMAEAFKKAFLPVLPTPQKVDFKTVWQNNEKGRSSFLQMPKAGYKNIVIAAHDPSKNVASVVMTQYENKNGLIEKFPYARKAATGAPAGAVAGDVPSGQTGWVPPVTATDNGDLF